MDAIDRKILAVLQENASLSVAEIGTRVGLSSTPCWKRIRRLEQDGYRIVGSTAEELATLLAAETDKWGAVIRASGIRID